MDEHFYRYLEEGYILDFVLASFKNCDPTECVIRQQVPVKQTHEEYLVFVGIHFTLPMMTLEQGGRTRPVP